MILYFADRHLNILGQATTHLPEGVRVIKDLKTEDVDTGVAIFECRIPFDRKTRAKVEEWAEVGNYILRSSDNENEFYNITDAEIDTKRQEVYIYAEDDGLDLLNDVAEAYEADQPYPISSYIERFAGGAGWEIGINEVEGLTKKLSWDSEQTASARLLSIAEGFNNCELSYSFEINGLQISKKYINIYEERGKDTGIQLRLNKEIDSIITTKSITNLATALNVTGGTPADADAPISLLGYEYDDGDFYVDGKVLKSRKALDKWSRYLWRDDETKQSGGHIVKSFSYATTSQAVLCEKAIEKLKAICDMEVNYDVDISKFPENVKVGDRVNIVDDAGELYLSSRVLILKTSVSDMTKKAVLGEHIIKKDGISEKVEALAEQFANIAQSRVFYTWIAYADDENGTNITTDPTGKAYIGIAANRTEEEVDISNPAVFAWSKVKGEDGRPGEPGESPFNIYVSPNLLDTCHVSAEGVVLNDTTIEIGQFVLRKGNDGVHACYMIGKGDSSPSFRSQWTWKVNAWSDKNNVLSHNMLTNINYGSGAYIRFIIPKDYKVDAADLQLGYIPLEIAINEENTSYWSSTYYYTLKIRLLIDPVSISTVTEKYQVSDSKTDAPTTWEDTAPEMTSDLPYLWNYEIITYSDGTTSETGKKVIGMYGAEGRGIKSITNYYQVNNDPATPPTSWYTDLQTTSTDNPYLWTKEIIEYTDGTRKEISPIIIGTHGATGPQGTAAVAYSMIANVYAIVRTASGKYIPENVILYGRSQSGKDTIAPYAGRFKIEYTTDNTNWNPGYTSTGNENEVTYKVPADIKAIRCSFYTADGFDTKLDEQIIPVVSDGLDGDGYTVILTNDSHTFAATYDGKAVPGSTTCKVFAYKGGSRVSATIGEVTDIPDGMSVSVDSTKNGTVDAEFTVTVDSNMITESGTITIPVTVDGKSFEKLMTYSLALAGPKGDKGDKGDSGVGISTVKNYYLATSSSSGVTTSTSGWTEAVQTPTKDKKYLWNYEEIIYTGDKTATKTAPCIIGVFGADGKGIKSITEHYLASASSSGVTTGTSGWSTDMQLTDSTKKYLWNYEIVTYTDNSTSTTTPVIIGVHGEKGDKGDTVSVSSVTEYYAKSSSNTSAPSSWSTTVPTLTNTDKYLWNYEVINYTDGTSTETSKRVMGVYGDTGSTGKGISSITNYYLATSASSNVTTATTGWTTTVQTMTSTKKYLWNYEVIAYTSGNPTTTTPVIIGTYGDKGDKGDPGKSISGVVNYYLATNSSSGVTVSTSGWTEAVQTPTKDKKYLWNYEKVTYSDNTSTTTAPCIIGNFAEEGKEGISISSVTEYYAKSSSSTSAPTDSSFSTSVPTLDATNKYLWNYEKIEYTGGKAATTTPKCVIGVFGEKGEPGKNGDPGKGIASFTNYYLASSSSSGVTTSTSGWKTTMQTTDTTNKYLWNYTVTTYTDGTSTTTTPIIIGTHGATGSAGKGISSTAITYQSSSSGTSTPTGTWNSSIPSVSAGYYLWTRTVITYTDGTTSTSYSIAKMGSTGSAGRGISSTAITYQASSSGTSTPTGTWNSSIPSLSDGQYLWTKTVITYTDNTTSTSYSVGMKGATGSAGKGVKSTAVTYQSHSSGTSAPTGTWNSSIPSITQGYYLWTRTVITYTDDTTSTSYSVSRIGIDGSPGDPGKDGQMLYATSTTAAATTAKNATLSTGSISSLAAGVTVTVKFVLGNSAASPTLNVNSTGAKSIALKGVALSNTNPYHWKAYDVITFVYDGAFWNIVDVAATRSRMTSEGLIIGDYSGDTLGSNVLITSSDVQIRNNKVVYATYGANKIELGKNSTASKIDLCNGSAEMSLSTIGNESVFLLSSTESKVGLYSGDKVVLHADYGTDTTTGTATVSAFAQGDPGIELTASYISGSNTYHTTIDVDSKTGIILLSRIPNKSTSLMVDPTTQKVIITGGLSVSGAITTGGVYLPGVNAINGYVKDTDGNDTSSTVQLLHLSKGNVTAIGYGGYSTATGSTALYGTDIIFYSKTAGNGATMRPYYRKNDTIYEGVMWLSGFTSGTVTDLYFMVPLSKPVMYKTVDGVKRFPEVSVEWPSTDPGFIVRQSGKYLYDSGGSTYKKPTTNGITATISENGGYIKVKASFSSSTNAVANTPCAISANIKFKFGDFES